MRRNSNLGLALATGTLFLGGASLGAQESTTRGFSVGLHGSGASLTIESQDRNDAGGGGIHLGYGINRMFMIFAQLDGARFDEQSTGAVEGDWALGHFDMGGRFHFANSLRSFVPYLQAAITLRAVGVADPVVNNTARNEVSISGGGFSLGGGASFYLTEAWALDLQLLWTAGEFTTFRVDNATLTGLDVDAKSSRLNLGVSWWP